MSRLWSQDCATTKSRIKSEHQQRERKKTVGANKGKGRELNPFSLHRQGDGGLLSSFEGDLRLVILADYPGDPLWRDPTQGVGCCKRGQ